ncbi:unnamed protein product, partial [marine sediment metagenome]
SRDEFEMLKEHWNVPRIAFDYLILKELRKLNKKLV